MGITSQHLRASGLTLQSQQSPTSDNVAIMSYEFLWCKYLYLACVYFIVCSLQLLTLPPLPTLTPSQYSPEGDLTAPVIGSCLVGGTGCGSAPIVTCCSTLPAIFPTVSSSTPGLFGEYMPPFFVVVVVVVRWVYASLLCCCCCWCWCCCF